ncbi:MAG: helix-turn-helix domain-containing protein [Eubacteriales bacterium]
MSAKAIGETIASLRRDKGITQEELGSAVGVSAQAVSKWECGGVPDTELLPCIADYFGVSVDAFFGRPASGRRSAHEAIAEYMQSRDGDRRMEAAFELCWTIQRSFMGNADLSEDKTSYLSILSSKEDQDMFSQILYDGGLSLMCMTESKPYYMLIPEAGGRSEALPDLASYSELFKILGDKEVLESLILLYRRVHNMPFTPKLLEKRIGINGDKAMEIIHALMKYKLIQDSQIELDDEEMTMYSFIPNPAFTALLTLAGEIIQKPCSFNYYCGGRHKSYI